MSDPTGFREVIRTKYKNLHSLLLSSFQHIDSTRNTKLFVKGLFEDVPRQKEVERGLETCGSFFRYDDVILHYDPRRFGEAREGFILTPYGVNYKKDLYKPNARPYRSIIGVKKNIYGFRIELKNRSIYFPCVENDICYGIIYFLYEIIINYNEYIPSCGERHMALMEGRVRQVNYKSSHNQLE